MKNYKNGTQDKRKTFNGTNKVSEIIIWNINETYTIKKQLYT